MSYDPIPARGVGSGLFDPPALFYLTNRKQIEEWANLKTAVSQSLSGWLRTTLMEELTGPCRERDFELTFSKGPSHYEAVVAHPVGATFIHGKPVIGAGIVWPPAVDADRNVATAVRCLAIAPGKRAGKLFRDAASGVVKVRNEANWPVYEPVKADDFWWTDLDGYRDLLVQAALQLIDKVAQPLAAASFIELTAAETSGTDSQVDGAPEM